MKDKLLSELKKGVKNCSDGELLAWRLHVVQNPYKGGENYEGFSDDVIKLIDEETTRRGKVKGLVSQEESIEEWI
jgi:hypothetical protein